MFIRRGESRVPPMSLHGASLQAEGASELPKICGWALIRFGHLFVLTRLCLSTEGCLIGSEMGTKGENEVFVREKAAQSWTARSRIYKLKGVDFEWNWVVKR